MQKLVRLRAFVQDSPLSSSVVLVQPKKEPHPVGQSSSPVIDLTPQGTRISRSWTFPVQSVHSTSEEPPQQATKPLPKPLRRALSRSSSLLPSLMLKSSSKDKRRAEKDDVPARKQEGRVSVVSGTGLANSRYTSGPRSTLWTESDSYLPRAKPPPPLKRIRHARNRCENNASSRDSTIPSRPSTSHCGSFEQSSESYSTASCSSRRGLDVPNIEISNEDGNQSAVDVQHRLTRLGTRTTIASGASEDSEIIFTPTSHSWQPPTNWAGPSKAVLEDKDHKPKLDGWFTRKKSVLSSSKGGRMQVSARLSRVRSDRKMMPAQVVDTGELGKEEAPVIRGRPVSSGVVVKIECCEGDGWHEKPMADIIPKLRQLKFK